MKYKRIHLIGLADGLKPKLILESLATMKFWNEREFLYITDSYEGIAVEFCKKENIKIIVIDKNDMISSINHINNTKPNLLLCIGWNKKIPNEFLNIFDKALNCHSGLLPDYRGDKAYMHTYANIEEEYGSTIHYMNSELDDGNIIHQGRLKLFLNEDPIIMHRRISEITALMIPEAVRLVEDEYMGEVQKGIARYFFKMTREEMNEIRNQNIYNINNGIGKRISRHKQWNL